MATSWRNKKNYPLGAGTLNTTITSSGLTIVLDASQGANFPSATFTVSIDEEIILIDSRSTDTLTVNASGRGYDGSTAAAHTAGVTVTNYQIAKDFTDIETAVNAIENGTAWSSGYTITRDDSGTNNVATALALYHTSTGTPAAGLGAKVLLGAENSTGTATSGAELQGYLSTVTAAAEVGVFLLQVRVAGALQDALQVSGGTNSATVGSNQTTANLWNTTATTVNAFGAATSINIGTGAGTLTILNRIVKLTGFPTSSALTGATLSVNATSAGAAGRLLAGFGYSDVAKWTCDVEGDVVQTGDLAVNGGDLTCSATTFNLLNATVTTLNIGGAATALNIGASNVAVTFGDAATFIAGSTTGWKIGTATTQKLGLWNVTPVVQPSSTGEAAGYTGAGGTALTHTDTFTGNSGTKAYTINDIVKHLKAIGALAAS